MIWGDSPVEVDVDMGRPDISRTVRGKLQGSYRGEPHEPIEVFTEDGVRWIIPARRILSVRTTE